MAVSQPSPWPENTKTKSDDLRITVNGDSTHANGKHGKVEWSVALSTPVRALTCATVLTPKYPSGKGGDKQSEAPVSARISPDMLAIEELLSAMKRTVKAVSDTCGSLGVQTAKVMDLAPAIQLSGQVSLLRTEVDEQCARQKSRVSEVEAFFESIADDVSKKVKARLGDIIREAIEKRIEERVRKELSEQIPGSLCEDALQHQLQILDIRTNLHNSEARRHNASIRADSLSQPLRPLLRPLPTPLQSPIRPFSATTPIPPTPPPTSALKSAISDVDVFQPPTPSPFFPRDMESLFKLGPEEARSLLRDYRLLEDIPEEGQPEEGSSTDAKKKKLTPTSTKPKNKKKLDGDGGADADTKEDDRERNLTKFMAHIGVPFQIVPGASNPKKGVYLPPLITSF